MAFHEFAHDIDRMRCRVAGYSHSTPSNNRRDVALCGRRRRDLDARKAYWLALAFSGGFFGFVRFIVLRRQSYPSQPLVILCLKADQLEPTKTRLSVPQSMASPSATDDYLVVVRASCLDRNGTFVPRSNLQFINGASFREAETAFHRGVNTHCCRRHG